VKLVQIGKGQVALACLGVISNSDQRDLALAVSTTGRECKGYYCGHLGLPSGQPLSHKSDPWGSVAPLRVRKHWPILARAQPLK